MKRLIAREDEQGVTLVELMIVISIVGVVMAATYNMFTFQQKSYSIQDNVAVMQQNVRVGLDYMVKEIRMAGYIPESIPPFDSAPSIDVNSGASEDIEEATFNTITIQADIDDDQVTETVSYALSGTDLTREVWQWNSGTTTWDAAGGAQIVADNIESITFAYTGVMPNGQDDDGDGTVDNDGEVCTWDFAVNGALNTADLREDIRDITISMTARTQNPDANYTHPQEGDHFRRRALTSNVCLRNMQ